MVLDPSSGYIHLLFSTLLCCVITHTHTVTDLWRVCPKGEGQGLTLGWSVHPFRCCAFLCTSNTTVTCCGSGQLSLPTYRKEPLHFPSSDDGNGICLDRFIQQESKKRKKCSWDVTRVHAAALLKTELSSRLSFSFIAFQCPDSCQTNDMFYIHHNLGIFISQK